MMRELPPREDDLPVLRRPPHSIEAEQSLLGAILLDPACLDNVADLVREQHLYRRDHRLIWDAISRVAAQHRPIDTVTVFEALRDRREADDAGGLAYLQALEQSVPSSRGVRRYAEIVREKAQRRAIIALSDELATAAFSGEKDLSSLLEQGQTSLAAVARQTVVKAPRRLSDIAPSRIDYYNDLESGNVRPGWPTGLPTLDDMIAGGFRAGGLYVLAARPKVGKSSLALWFAWTMAKDRRPTLMLSMEMPDVEVVDRAVATVGAVDYGALTRGRMSAADWSGAVDALEKMKALPMYVDDEPGLTLAAIRAKARQVPGLKVLFVDYLQLASGTRSGETRNSEIEELTRGLKALAKSDDLAVIVLSQLNREVEKRHNKRPQLADLRDSGAIEQDADVVLMLWPHRSLENSQKIVGCAVEANRQGSTGAFALHFDMPRQRWGESDQKLDSEDGGYKTQRGLT